MDNLPFFFFWNPSLTLKPLWTCTGFLLSSRNWGLDIMFLKCVFACLWVVSPLLVRNWKNSKKQPKIKKNVLKKKFFRVILYKNYWSYFFHEDFVIHQHTLMLLGPDWLCGGLIHLNLNFVQRCETQSRIWEEPVRMWKGLKKWDFYPLNFEFYWSFTLLLLLWKITCVLST